MSSTTWRKYARHAGLLALALLAWQGVLYYVGSEPLPLRDLTIIFVGMALLTWAILRKNPDYYDRNRAKAPDVAN